MVSEKVKIDGSLGIHLRPAAAMCSEAVKFSSVIEFSNGNSKTANVKSVISILAAGVKCGDEIVMTACGEDEQEALRAVLDALYASLQA